MPATTTTPSATAKSGLELHRQTRLENVDLFLRRPLGGGAEAVGAPTFDLLELMIYVGTDAGVIYGIHYPLP